MAEENEVGIQNKIKAQVQTAYPELIVDSVEKTPVSGLYQLTAGPVVLYASNDGRYLVAGDMLDLERDLENRNITESRRRQIRMALLKHLHAKELIENNWWKQHNLSLILKPDAIIEDIEIRNLKKKSLELAGIA